MLKRIVSISCFFLVLTPPVFAQQIAPLWEDFIKAKKTGATPILPDFSYAGYHFSERSIPDPSKKHRFNVVDYGAKPDDAQYDDEAIQRAVDAAEKSPSGGVVFFPPGKYMLAADHDSTKHIRISKSNIVIKGSGSGAGGTEIFQDKMRIHGRQIQFRPSSKNSRRLTTITRNASRESFWVEVADASSLKAGQDVVIYHRSEEFTKAYFAPLQLKAQWTRLFGPNGGMLINEIHTIEQIEGKRIKFKNPIHFDLKIVNSKPFELRAYSSIEECGVEDILFSSNWKTYPEDFVHHKNAIHDYAWEAVGMHNVKNSWVRNCVFKDWNEGLYISEGYQISVLNVDFEGKKGHASVHARTGYGVLIKNCNFNNAQHHGAGTGYSASGTVITQCTLGTDQNIDIHSGQPLATLYDQMKGGVFFNLGGPEPGYPHHGKQLVLWNFQHSSEKDQHYNFWDPGRRRNFTIAEPILVGFQSDRNVTFENTGTNQMQGKMVKPESLFEAQLLLRLKGEHGL